MKITTKTNEVTHNPEKPSLHHSKRHPDSGILKNVHEGDDRNSERNAETTEDESECSEEGLHYQEDQVNDQMVGPKPPRQTNQDVS